jgi:hypothetical protein
MARSWIVAAIYVVPCDEAPTAEDAVDAIIHGRVDVLGYTVEPRDADGPSAGAAASSP